MRDRIWKSHQTDPDAIPSGVLFERLQQAIKWTRRQLDSGPISPTMRSKEIQWCVLNDGRDDVLCDVGVSRQIALRDYVETLPSTAPDLLGGKMMVYFPDRNLCDGAAEQETNGFFDVFNIPPWDTWVGYFEDRPGRKDSDDSYLLAYVPKEFVELANDGMIVNPEKCILWLSNTNVKIRGRFP